jgi:hypothetical protein
LSEPLATTLRQFFERNAEDTRLQIDETIERAMDLAEAGKFKDAWEAKESLRGCYMYPGLTGLWEDFNTFYAARLLVNAGDLGQYGRMDEARQELEWLTKNYRTAPAARAEALFRIDLSDYTQRVLQAVKAVNQGDLKGAQTRIDEARPILARLLASPGLQDLFPDLPPKERGSQLTAMSGEVQATIWQRAAAGH